MNIRDMVVGFYHQYYSANQMRLVVYGREPLDQLEQWVRDKFTAVPNQELSRPVFAPDPFSESQLRRYAEVVPIKDVKALTIYFPVPEVSRWVDGWTLGIIIIIACIYVCIRCRCRCGMSR